MLASRCWLSSLKPHAHRLFSTQNGASSRTSSGIRNKSKPPTGSRPKKLVKRHGGSKIAKNVQSASHDVAIERLANAFESLRLELEKKTNQPQKPKEMVTPGGIHASAFRSIFDEPSDETPTPTISATTVKTTQRKAPRKTTKKAQKVKKVIKATPGTTAPTFSIEMDPTVERDLKKQLGVEELPYSQVIQPLSTRYKPSDSDTSDPSSTLNNTSTTDKKTIKEDEATAEGDTKRDPLRIQTLKSELEKMEDQVGLKKDKPKKQLSEKVKRQRALAKQLKLMYEKHRGMEVWSWKKIKKLYNEHKPIVREMNKYGMRLRNGKYALPKRPPPMSVMREMQEEKEYRMAQNSRTELGVFPRSLFSGAPKTEFSQKAIEFTSRRFFARVTSWSFIGYLVAVIVAYEVYLSVNEYYYTKNPDSLSRQLDEYMQVNGEFKAIARREAEEQAWIVENRNKEWRNLQYGWLPDVFWRWLLRSEEQHIDPTVLLIKSAWNGLKESIMNFNLEFFVKHSRFWQDHAYEASLARKLAESLRSNESLSLRLRTHLKEPLRRALDNDMVAEQFIRRDGLALLLDAYAVTMQESDRSVEALLARTTLSSPYRVATFWSLPTESLKLNLETLVVHTDTNPKLVAFVVATLLSHGVPSIDVYSEALLVSIITRLRSRRQSLPRYVGDMAEMAAKSLCSGASERDPTTLSLTPFQEFREENELSDKSKRLMPVPKYDFDLENVKRTPSVAWIALSLPMMAGYTYMKYDSNSLWNGMGSLPIKVRKVQVMKRFVPALVASATWLVIDAYWSSVCESMQNLMKQGRVEEKEGESRYKRVVQQGGSVALPLLSPGRTVVQSLVLSFPFWSLQVSLLWKHPFVFFPQFIAQCAAHPIVWFRKWRHRRMQSL